MYELNTFNDLAQAALPLAALITALVQVAKKTLAIKTGRFIPLLSIVIGASIGFLLVEATGLGALVGVALGLTGTGLYEFGKTTVGGK